MTMKILACGKAINKAGQERVTIMLRFLTAGESHGQYLTAIIEGFPAGMPLTDEEINRQLARRQRGYGRGKRMEIERDKVNILSGVRHGLTTGSPITLQIANRDWENWRQVMAAEPLFGCPADNNDCRITRPRPGHADLAGALKYRHQDMRDVLERASARETACRTAVGSVARCLLKQLDIIICGQVLSVGTVSVNETVDTGNSEIRRQVEQSEMLVVDKAAEQAMKEEIDKACKQGDTLGGVFRLDVHDLPVGLGSYTQWDRRLDGRIAGALMSIQSVKGVEIGMGFQAAQLLGSQVHDEILYGQQRGFYRATDNAGGIEGGMTNGGVLWVRAAVKPIPTLTRPLSSVDFITKQKQEASAQRSDVCVVPAACVVAQNVLSWEIAVAIAEKFGADSLEELRDNYKQYQQYLRQV